MNEDRAINEVWPRIDREVWLLTSRSGGVRAGLIATFVSQASIVPELPRVVVGLARQHHTWQAVETSRAFVLHLLAEDQLDLVWRFGLQSGRDVDKWAGLSCDDTGSGGPRLAGAVAWLDCRVEAVLETGDRSVYLAEVRDGRVERAGAPLTMRRVVEQAPAEQLAELREGLRRDAAVDAAAIRTWRAARRQGQG